MSRTRSSKIAHPAPPPVVVTWSARRQVVISVVFLGLLVCGFGLWSVYANISGAVIAAGSIAVDNNRQVVQHPDGGIVAEIVVAEGTRVEAGQVLIRLDSEELSSEAGLLRDQIVEIDVRSARLEAERDGDDAVSFPETVIKASVARPAIIEAMEGQISLMEAILESRARQRDQLKQRRDQIMAQVEGVTSQQTAIGLQLDFVREGLEAQRILLDRGLTQISQLLDLQREEASMIGEEGRLAAVRAELEGKAIELDIEMLSIETQAREKVIIELRELQFKKTEAFNRLSAVETRLARLDVRAPTSGIIHDMQIFALRSVVAPGAPILHVVPQDRPLVIQAQVDPTSVDQVYPGQPVTLRLPAFDARTTPELQGRVSKVSPDAFFEEASGAPYYRAEIIPNKGEVERLDGLVLLPGMPVESLIRTENRSPLSYFVKPIMDYFVRAFRE